MELNEPFEGHEHASTSLKVVLLVFAVVLIGALAYLIQATYSQPDTTEEVAPSVMDETEETTTATDTEKTYSSTAGYFSFDYPSDQAVYTMSGEGPDSTSVTATASSTDVFVGDLNVEKSSEGIFFSALPGITSLSETTIQAQFSATKPENLAVTATTVGGKDGFKVVVKGDMSVVSTFYFVANSAGKVLKFTVLNNNDVAAGIFASLKVN